MVGFNNQIANCKEQVANDASGNPRGGTTKRSFPTFFIFFTPYLQPFLRRFSTASLLFRGRRPIVILHENSSILKILKCSVDNLSLSGYNNRVKVFRTPVLSSHLFSIIETDGR